MTEYLDKEAYCREYCNCNSEYCDKAACPIFSFPAADVAPVVHGAPTTKMRTVLLAGYYKERGVTADDGATLYRKRMTHANIPYDHCPMCGATLCSRWHNYCGKCGAKMDKEVTPSD